MIADLVRRNRSCRRFYQNQAVALETLKELVNLGRLSASAANLQPLSYILSSSPNENDQIFSCLKGKGYIKEWPGPKEGERHPDYIIVLGDTGKTKNFECDHGIASQSILLGAREIGLSGCMVGSINRNKLRRILNISAQYKILLVLAIGKPKEQVVIEEVGADGNIQYWVDDQGVHHVPKRNLNDIIVGSD